MARTKKDEAVEPESAEAQPTEQAEPHDPYARTDKDAPQAKPRPAPNFQPDSPAE